MTAREMFEELGYKCVVDLHTIRYFKKRDDNAHHLGIIFNLKYASFCAYDAWNTMDIDMPTFKAITKQLEELGWL